MKRHIVLTSLFLVSATACGKSSNSSGDTATLPSADATGNAANAVSAGTVPAVDPNNSASTPAATPDAAAPVTEVPVVEAPAEVVSLEVDATSKTDFAHLDLDTGKIVPASDLSWDLAFKRTVIKMNKDVTAQVVIDSTFEAILKAPTDIYVADAPVALGKETDGLVFHSGLGWYAYDMTTHVISSNNYVYFVKANDGVEYKVSVNDYYSIDRLPAFIQVKWIKVTAAKAE